MQADAKAFMQALLLAVPHYRDEKSISIRLIFCWPFYDDMDNAYVTYHDVPFPFVVS